MEWSPERRRGTYQELLLLLLCRLVVETTGLDNLVINVKLITSTRKHRLLDTLLRDETQNTDDLRLSDTVSTILRLQIGVWIPITIKAVNGTCELCLGKQENFDDSHDDRVGSLQVETETTGTR